MLAASLIGGGMALCPSPAMAAVAQSSETITVKGQVIDQGGEPLIGATVKVKGSTGGSVTDIEGNFEL